MEPPTPELVEWRSEEAISGVQYVTMDLTISQLKWSVERAVSGIDLLLYTLYLSLWYAYGRYGVNQNIIPSYGGGEEGKSIQHCRFISYCSISSQKMRLMKNFSA